MLVTVLVTVLVTMVTVLVTMVTVLVTMVTVVVTMVTVASVACVRSLCGWNRRQSMSVRVMTRVGRYPVSGSGCCLYCSANQLLLHCFSLLSVAMVLLVRSLALLLFVFVVYLD